MLNQDQLCYTPHNTSIHFKAPSNHLSSVVGRNALSFLTIYFLHWSEENVYLIRYPRTCMYIPRQDAPRSVKFMFKTGRSCSTVYLSILMPKFELFVYLYPSVILRGHSVQFQPNIIQSGFRKPVGSRISFAHALKGSQKAQQTLSSKLNGIFSML